MDLDGKTILITGASSGLGFAVARLFANRGAHEILVCRNREKGEKAVSDIKKEVAGANINLMICDLESMQSIHAFVEQFEKTYPKLDILYNNAAVMKRKRTLTEDGFEAMFQVNYLAPFIFMRSLINSLKKGTEPQIINNGRPQENLRLDLDDLQFEKSYHMYHSFFKTKLCLVFASLEFSQRLEEEGISVYMAEPGTFKSELVREMPLAGWFKNLFSAPVEKAAENMIHVITREDVKDKNGKIFTKRKEVPLTDYWKEPGIRQKLWSITNSLLENKR